jgi:hypothetical protein
MIMRKARWWCAKMWSGQAASGQKPNRFIRGEVIKMRSSQT